MNARPIAAAAALGLALLFSAGCATSEGESLSEQPTFALGYGDGCQTGVERDKSFSTKSVRDAQLFDSDKAYRAGWRHGFQSCGKRDSKAPDGGRILGDENGTSF